VSAVDNPVDNDPVSRLDAQHIALAGGALALTAIIVVLALALSYGVPPRDIWRAALAKMRLRATGVKDHAAERAAIAAALHD
jgi:hypothetical protein